MVAYLCRVNLSTVLDKLANGLGVSVEYLGIASSVYFVTYAVGQLLNGTIGDRVNPYRFLMLALTMTGSINLILGLQTSGLLFLILWGLNGFCQSMFWSTLLRLLSFHAVEGQRKNVSTVMSTCSVTGYLLSWVVLSTLFQPCGYRPYFLVPGVIALVLVAAWYILSQRLPFTGVSGDRAPTPPLPQVAREFVNDQLFFICMLCALVGAIQEGAVFWLPLIFTNVLDLGSHSLLYLVMVPLAKLTGVFLARAVLSAFRDDARRAMLIMLSAACVIAGALVLTSQHTSFMTVLLIAGLIAVINAGNWYMISYLPLYFSERNIVSTLVGTFDFSTYIGASLMSGSLGVLLSRYGWVILPLMWLVLAVAGLALAFTGAGACLRRKGARR
jgi:OPA family glycerol-3-phosphate transporter-like MFS transporter